jgi:dUTP pyrophosphatase
MEIKIVNNSRHPLPKYEVFGSAGMDLRANLENKDSIIHLPPMGRVLVKTGLHVQLPEGYEAQIRPRSGLAYKHGVTVLNSPGTIDSCFTGNVGVILVNLSNDSFTIKDGDRIAQMVVAKHETAVFSSVEVLEETERGEGGFGHTGT